MQPATIDAPRPLPLKPVPVLRSGRMLVEWWIVLLLASLGTLAMNILTPPVRLDNLLYDSVQRLNPPPPSEDILIIVIDNRSLAELGRWPWPRDYHARLIEQLTAMQPRVIAYDVLFPERSPDPADDARMAAAMQANGRVLLPHIIEIPGPDGAPSNLVPPVPPLAAAARGMGHVVVRPDRDGVVRGIDRLENASGHRLPHLMEVMIDVAEGRTPARPDHGPLGPVLAPARDLIRFGAGPGGYAEVSFADVMMGRVPATLVKGRMLLVGATGSGLGDRLSTPMSSTQQTMAGVELNANYLDSLMHDRLVRPASPLLWQLWSMVPLWLLMASLLLLGPRINLWVGLALSVMVVLVTFVALGLFRFWLPPSSALIALGLVYPLWGWRRLDFASRYMVAELRELADEGTPLPREPVDAGGDPVERQIILMHQAIRDVRDLRRFVAQSLDSLPDAAIVTDLDGRIMIANDAADALFGHRVGRPLIGLQLARVFRCLDVDARFPDPRATELLEAMRRGALAPDHGYEMRTADGLSLEIRLAFFTDSERRPLGWIARFADITNLRASERQREDALRLLTHDMRAPQASILAILQSEGAALPADLARRLERYAHQTLALADDFVNLARAESGNYKVEQFNLSDALLDAADDMWPLANAKHIRIRTEVPDEEALVLGDRSLITRSIINFLSNAVKYSGDNTQIMARVSLRPELVEVAVMDQGRGIAEADLEGLFEPFRRLAAPEGAAVSADAPGAGLGLAFVKAVVERHRGTLHVTSEVGKGSVFAMRIPRAA